MEEFAPLQIEMFGHEDDPAYFSLSQFDVDLTRSTDATAVAPGPNSWDVEPLLFLNSLPDITSQISSYPIGSMPLIPVKQEQTNPPIVYSNLPPTPTDLPLSATPAPFPHHASSLAQPPTLASQRRQPTHPPHITPQRQTVPAPPAPHETTPPMSEIMPSLSWTSDLDRHTDSTTLSPLLPSTSLDHQAASSMPPQAQKKTAHNAIERRYRNNINDRIAELKNAVPALLHAKLKDSRTTKRSSRTMDDDDDENADGEEYLDGVAVATKLNKATILRKATEYIVHLKRASDDLRRENVALQHLVAQLPGGQDVLMQYRLQRLRREQELQRQQVLERRQQKEQQQMRKGSRKRARYQSQEHEEDETSSSSSGPATPPGASSRTFLALFLGLSLISPSSWLVDTTKHHHLSRTTSTSTPTTASTMDTVLVIARTLALVIAVLHLAYPFLSLSSFIKIKRVSVATRLPRRHSPSHRTHATAITRAYRTRLASFERIDHDVARALHGSVWLLGKELTRLVLRYGAGYDVVTEPPNQKHLQGWIDMNEVDTIGGRPETNWVAWMCHAVKLINVVDQVDTQVTRLRVRAYVTAALRLSSLERANLPVMSRAMSSFASWAGTLVWQRAVDEIENDEDDPCCQALASCEPTQLPTSRAWTEALATLEKGKIAVSPIALLVHLYLVDRLGEQFRRLIDGMIEGTPSMGTFAALVELTQPYGTDGEEAEEEDEEEGLSTSMATETARWLALVGQATHAIWHHDAATATRVTRSLQASTDEMRQRLSETTCGAAKVVAGQTREGRDTLMGVASWQPWRREARGIEQETLMLAEFAVGWASLDAWITLWSGDPLDVVERVRDTSRHLRRLVSRPALSWLSDNTTLIERLSRLERLVHPDDDLACEEQDGKEQLLLVLHGRPANHVDIQ